MSGRSFLPKYYPTAAIPDKGVVTADNNPSRIAAQQITPSFAAVPAKGATIGIAFRAGPCCVSIHAPAQGATIVQNSVNLFASVSIHAPAQGATRCKYESEICLEFQFTPPRRGRPR